jgi:hypothetical protein
VESLAAKSHCVVQNRAVAPPTGFEPVLPPWKGGNYGNFRRKRLPITLVARPRFEPTMRARPRAGPMCSLLGAWTFPDNHLEIPCSILGFMACVGGDKWRRVGDFRTPTPAIWTRESARNPSKIPCQQGIGGGDEFAADCRHRQSSKFGCGPPYDISYNS